MSTLQPDHAMKDSSTYLPILRSVLKSQIQFLVEQLSDAGEETLILSANITDGEVDQLGSESGKLFVDVYDDFKSEFLGFCQRRKAKRKLESPQKTPLDAKRGKTVPAVLSIPKATVQSVMSPQNVPKVSAARVIVSQKPTTTQARSVPGNQLTQESSDEQDIGELEQSEEDYQEMEGSELGYEALEDVETWQGTDTEEGVETPSSSQDLASSSQEQSSVSRVRTVAVQKKTVTTQKSKRGSFACDECGKVFAQKVTLKTHSLRHGEKTYHCKCGKSFFTKTELNNHNRFMHFEGERKPPKKRFVCRFCDVRYARKENLTIHIKKYHENDEPEFYCNICDKYFYARKSFKAHNRRHGEKNFQCSKCSKLFVTEAELNLHETHGHRDKKPVKAKPFSVEKMFKKALSCSECGKLFMRADILKLHMLSHTNQFPFTCHICGLQYRKKWSYEQHIAKKHPEDM